MKELPSENKQDLSKQADSVQNAAARMLPEWLTGWHKMRRRLHGIETDPQTIAEDEKKRADAVAAKEAEIRGTLVPNTPAQIKVEKARKERHQQLFSSIRGLFNKKAADKKLDKIKQNLKTPPRAFKPDSPKI